MKILFLYYFLSAPILDPASHPKLPSMDSQHIIVLGNHAWNDSRGIATHAGNTVDPMLTFLLKIAGEIGHKVVHDLHAT